MYDSWIAHSLDRKTMPHPNRKESITAETLYDDHFNLVFTEYLKTSTKKQILNQNKVLILKQCRKKLSTNDIAKMTEVAAQAKMMEVLKQTVYSCAYIPEGLIGSSDALEADSLDQETDELDLKIIARNLFRYIERGAEVDGRNKDVKTGLAFVEKALSEKRHPGLSKALREEFQNILDNIVTRLANSPCEDEEKHYAILISNMLAAYTFIDPHEEESKRIRIPQKIEGFGWRPIEYCIEPLDLSPQSGLLKKLMLDEDKIYAYGLVPVYSDSQAQSQLLLMGTTYPTGQGAGFSNLHKFDPRHSVGEAYDWEIVAQWLAKQKNKVKVTGHSQGGSSAMYVTAKYPQYIIQADCLNPPALCTATLNRLNHKWLKLRNKPCINVYVQQGDPVYSLENGFLKGTRIFQIISGVEKCSNFNPILPTFFQKTLEAHLHHFVGRESSIILELDAQQESFTPKREFFADMKGTINWVIYPFMYLDLAKNLAVRQAKIWCIDNLPTALTTSVAYLSFIPIYAFNFVLNTIINLTEFILLTSALLVTAVCSGIKIGIKSACNSPFEPESHEIENCERRGLTPSIV